MRKILFLLPLFVCFVSCVVLDHATVKISSFHVIDVKDTTGAVIDQRVEYDPAYVCFLPGDTNLPEKVINKAFSIDSDKARFAEIKFRGKRYTYSDSTFFVIKETDLKENDSNISDILLTGKYDKDAEDLPVELEGHEWWKRNRDESGDVIEKIWKMSREELTSTDKLVKGFSWIILPLYLASGSST